MVQNRPHDGAKAAGVGDGKFMLAHSETADKEGRCTTRAKHSYRSALNHNSLHRTFTLLWSQRADSNRVHTYLPLSGMWRHYSGNRHYSAHCHYLLFPSVPSDATGTISGNRHHSTGTIEGPIPYGVTQSTSTHYGTRHRSTPSGLQNENVSNAYDDSSVGRIFQAALFCCDGGRT